MSLPPIARPVPNATGRVPAITARANDDGALATSKPFEGLLSSLKGSGREAGAFLGDQVPKDGHRFHAPTAARFNEHGFFHGAVGARVDPASEPAPDGASIPADGSTVEGSAVALAPVFADPGAGTTNGAAETITARPVEVQDAAKATVSSGPTIGDASFHEARAAAAVGFVTTPRPTLAATRTIAQPAAVRASPAAAALSPRQEPLSAREEAATPSAAPKRIAILIEKLLNQARATGVRVDVHTVEEGLKIVARTEKMDRAERGRLLAEISALVARHGRAPARISLNGESAPEQRPWRA